MKKSELRNMWQMPSMLAAKQAHIDALREKLQPSIDTCDIVQGSAPAPSFVKKSITIRAKVETNRSKEIRALIKSLEEDLDAETERYIKMHAEAESVLGKINGEKLRAAAYMACLDGKGWEEIADVLGTTGDNWKKRVNAALSSLCE